MCDNVRSNPFAGLFSSVNDAVSFSQQRTIDDESKGINDVERSLNAYEDGSYNVTESKISKTRSKVDQLVEDVFGLVLHSDNNSSQRALVFIDTDSIEHAVFERVMLEDPITRVTNNQYISKSSLDDHVIQKEVISYLYESYCRLKHYRATNGFENTIKEICQIVLRNANTALQEPDLFQGQEV